MKGIRTANAGLQICTDGITVLFDGVTEAFPPYLGTPKTVLDALAVAPPDVVAYTHLHPDHYDAAYASSYSGRLLMPGAQESAFINGVHITGVPTRHIGKTDIAHLSFVLTGSQVLWFMGDATPLALKVLQSAAKPDVLVVPFAYALTPSAWRDAKNTGAEKIVLLHLPDRRNDPDRLWDTVLQVAGQDAQLYIPNLGECFEF